MRPRSFLFPAAAAAVLLPCSGQSAAGAGGNNAKGSAAGRPRRNVLIIIIDDLRPRLGGWYGVDDSATPHLDALQREGTTFTRAYAQQTLCAPSRASFLTGKRPHETQCWNFVDSFRDGTGMDWTSLPEFFKLHDYTTLGTGKIFHKGLPPNFDQDRSWSAPWTYPEESEPCPDTTAWCTVDADPSNATFADAQIVSQGLRLLQEAAAGEKNFFLAMGLRRPHLPWRVPKEFFDRHPLESVALPRFPKPPDGMPPVAYHQAMGDWCQRFSDVMELIPCAHPYRPYPANATAAFRRAYYAAVSMADHQVGRILAGLLALGPAIERNTVVAVFGDHGYTLGEWGLWEKHTMFEAATRVPLILRVPGGPAGVRIESIVELLDLYPTLVELAGLELPAALGLRGRSLAPFVTGSDIGGGGCVDGGCGGSNGAREEGDDFRDGSGSGGLGDGRENDSGDNGDGDGLPGGADQRWWWQRASLPAGRPLHGPAAKSTGDMKEGGSGGAEDTEPAAFSEFPRCVQPGRPAWWHNDCGQVDRRNFTHMGLSVRTVDWRLTRWFKWDGAALTVDWAAPGAGAELYSYGGDSGGRGAAGVEWPGEAANLAAEPALAGVVARLTARLEREFGRYGRSPPARAAAAPAEAAAAVVTAGAAGAVTTKDAAAVASAPGASAVQMSMGGAMDSPGYTAAAGTAPAMLAAHAAAGADAAFGTGTARYKEW